MTFSASISASIFSSIFDGKWLPKWSGETYVNSSFWRPFHDLFRRSTFECILVALWLTFGSLLTPFGCLLAPFGSLLAPFWWQLAHFWCPGLVFAPHFFRHNSLINFPQKLRRQYPATSPCTSQPLLNHPFFGPGRSGILP